MPRYDEQITPVCVSCGQALPGNTTLILRTDDGRMYQNIKWWADNLRCPSCKDRYAKPKYRRMSQA